MAIEYRMAIESDLPAIVAFVDYWLTGGGLADGIPGAGHDYFVRFGQQKDYIAKYAVLLALCEGEIVGWAIKTKKGVLIHLLVAATFRHRGIGGEMLRRMAPEIVRSKSDQAAGDPAAFYLRQGFVRATGERLGRKANIDIFAAPGVDTGDYLRRQAKGGGRAKGGDPVANGTSGVRRRSIDAIGKRLAKGGGGFRRYEI